MVDQGLSKNKGMKWCCAMVKSAPEYLDDRQGAVCSSLTSRLHQRPERKGKERRMDVEIGEVKGNQVSLFYSTPPLEALYTTGSHIQTHSKLPESKSSLTHQYCRRCHTLSYNHYWLMSFRCGAGCLTKTTRMSGALQCTMTVTNWTDQLRSFLFKMPRGKRV